MKFEADKLSNTAKELIKRADEPFFVSTISITEIAIKDAKKNILAIPFDDFMENLTRDHESELLTYSAGAAANLRNMPLFHRDPFGRMLIGVARSEDVIFLTPDKKIHQYPVMAVW